MNGLTAFIGILVLAALCKAFSLSIGVFIRKRLEDRARRDAPPAPPKPPRRPGFYYCPNCKCTLEEVTIEGKVRNGCKGCGWVHWDNPLPVAVAVIPYGKGLVFVRRKVEPRAGFLALPGGFVEKESLDAGAVREALEETGLEVEIDRYLKNIYLERVNQILVFFLMKPATGQKLKAGSDATECVFLNPPYDREKMAFPTHEAVVNEYLAQYKG